MPEKQITLFNEHGSDTSFFEYEPLAIDLHYRDPLVYKEMLDIIGDLEIAKLKNKLKNAIRFSCQIDGSVDSMQNDNKIIFIRFNTPTDPIEVKTQLVSVCSSELRGSAGLEDVFVRSMQKIGFDDSVIKDKFAGVTTDGESANTGKNTGLWPRLEKLAGRKLLNFWCSCHRSDLAMEDIEASVPELKHWKSNLLSIPAYYHKSAVRTKELTKLLPSMKAYPSYHNVRFSQHLNNVCIAVLNDLDATLKHWTNIQSELSTDEYNKNEKAAAKGFLNQWKDNGLQTYLTPIMSDVCSVFQILQKQLQKVS